MAVGTYPFLARMSPKDFTRLLAVTEIALGSALLLPVVPAGLAGAGLTAFSAGLLGLYGRTPGMRKEGSPFPTERGITPGQGRVDAGHRPRSGHRRRHAGRPRAARGIGTLTSARP